MEQRVSKVPSWNRTFARRFATALGTNPAAALLDTPKIRLWKDVNFNPDADALEAAFEAVECDFDDYVEKTFTSGVPANSGDEIIGSSCTVTWTIDEATVDITNTVCGYFVTDANGVVLFERFATEDRVQMTANGDQLVLTVFLPIQLQVTLDDAQE